MFILPMVFIILIMGFTTGGGQINVGVVDQDQTKLSARLIEHVKETNNVRMIPESRIKKLLTESSVDYVMVIPKNFASDIIQGKATQIKGYSIQESNVALPAKYSINNFLSSAKNIGIAANGSEQAFYKGLSAYEQGSFSTVLKRVKNNDNKGDRTLTALGFLIMSMLFIGNNCAQMILEDKTDKTFYRIFAGPITPRNYMLQNIASFLTAMVLQLAIILTIMKTAFHGYFGTSILNIFGLYVIFGMFCVALGVGIMSFSKTSRQAGTLNTFITVPMCMLGGCFWPASFMPDLLQKISNLMPTTWVLRASRKIIEGGSLMNVGVEISVILLFALVFVLLGSWKKADITR